MELLRNRGFSSTGSGWYPRDPCGAIERPGAVPPNDERRDRRNVLASLQVILLPTTSTPLSFSQ